MKAERIVGSDYHLAEKTDNGALQHTRRPDNMYSDNAFTQHASCEGGSALPQRNITNANRPAYDFLESRIIHNL